MALYITRRILEAIPSLLGITLISFILLHIVPGSPVRLLLGQHYTPARAAALARNFGLNRPLYQQYVLWLWHAVHGNFGFSYVYNEPVLHLINLALPHTLELVSVAIVVAHIVSVLLGSLQAYYADSAFDRIVTVMTYFFYAMPGFWIGILMIELFSITLGWFPSGNYVSPLLTHPGIWNYLYHLVLPALTLIITAVAGWARYMRSSMRETLIMDYIRTARAKGTSEFRMLFVHALRNSVLPLITLFGLSLPGLFAGAIVIEEIFSYPGMGLLYWTATNTRDYPILLALIVMFGALTIAGNLIADILYSLVDPRIQYQ